jgi:nitroimidazol reductase NimA-like FMN-containing flavoprotein (pyridoxamine 5'-phosphate oxidase superfamily)
MDIINSATHWQSVLVFGKFEELSKEKAAEIHDLLFSRILTLMTGGSQHTFGTEQEKLIEPGGRYKAVMFRILIKEKTGRYESMLMS